MFKKKTLIYIFTTIASIFLFFFITGCSGVNSIASIQVENQSEESPITFVVGEFSFEDLNLIVKYENKETKTVQLTENMINQDDLIKLYKLGKNEIEVKYENKKTTMHVYGTYKEFADLYLEDVTTTYTGEEFKVEVGGNVPDTARIVYPLGNTYKNAGTYTTKAIVFENGYEVLELSAKVVINKAQYDMSSVKFVDGEYTYDGTEKMLSIQGDLPDGVSVTYFINGMPTRGVIDSGEYEVTAVFTGDSKNYEPIAEQKAKLTINKATHNMEGIRLEDSEFIYDSGFHELTLINESLLPEGVRAIYTNNKQTEVGIYEVIVEFELDDPLNYEAIDSLTATMKIEKAEYDLSEYYLLDQKIDYDSVENYEPSFNKDIPEFINIEYSYYPQNVSGRWNSLNIDATEGYWYKANPEYVSVGQGTVITLKVNEQQTITLEALNDINNFDVNIENGVATITCVNEDGLKSIKISDTSNTTTIDVTQCDLIFHNENEPLSSEVLPSLKGEYIVVVKLTVVDNNYYGEKELTALLIIE